MPVESKKRPRGLSKLSLTPEGSSDQLSSAAEAGDNPAPGLDSSAFMRFEQDGPDVEVRADDLKLIQYLGRGFYGHVDKMRHIPTGFILAVKRIRLTDDTEQRKRMLMDLEVNKMNNVRQERSAYVISSYGALFREGDIWICMELMDASLDSFCKKVFEQKSVIPEDVLRHIAFAIVSGLKFLKDQFNIMHRDVKPSNILLSRDGDVKLCDFGISAILERSFAKTNIGSELYMAPERVDPTAASDGPGFGVQADVWSLGISMIELATGKHPYPVFPNKFKQIDLVVKEPAPELPRNFSVEFQDFIRQCCNKDYVQRPKYDALLKHAFLRQEVEQPINIAPFVQAALDGKLLPL